MTTLDPETERIAEQLEFAARSSEDSWLMRAAAAHIRQLATERDTARRCREINQEQREEWRAKCDAAQRERYDAMARVVALQQKLAKTKAELARCQAAEARASEERYAVQCELTTTRASLAAEGTLRASFGRHLRELAEGYDLAPEGAFEPAEVVRAAIAAKGELERLREAVRWFVSEEDVNASLTHWVSGNSEVDDEEPFGDDPPAALIRLHERDKP